MTPELAREITAGAARVGKAPEGFQKQRAVADLLKIVARERGYAWHEMPMSFWYANILSSPLTHLANVIGNSTNLAANLALRIARDPLGALDYISATARGLGRGGGCVAHGSRHRIAPDQV